MERKSATFLKEASLLVLCTEDTDCFDFSVSDSELQEAMKVERLLSKTYLGKKYVNSSIFSDFKK